jgi:cytoskeletal protein CcmA (bactofilin family)
MLIAEGTDRSRRARFQSRIEAKEFFARGLFESVFATGDIELFEKSDLLECTATKLEYVVVVLGEVRLGKCRGKQRTG